jgi:CubicO group peptidase (beta-lactamase class C family)
MNQPTSESDGFSAHGLKQIDNLMQDYVDLGKLAGVVSLIARSDQIVHQGAFGLRDLISGHSMDADAIFRIYSMTKPITSLAFMMLYEQGLLQLTDPVRKFLPEFEKVQILEPDGAHVDPDRQMIVLDLLRHTAGLSYGGFRNSQDPVDQLYDQADLFNSAISLDEMVRRVADLPLIHHPGEVWRYSVATDVLGRLIEVISGSPIEEFLDQHIFEPLGMVDTAFSYSTEKMDRFATVYEWVEGDGLQPLNASDAGNYLNPNLHLGGQGLASTAQDYLRFAQLMQNKGEWQGTRIIERETVESMVMNHLPDALIPISYNGIVEAQLPGIGFGLGFSVLTDPDQAGIMGSQGDYGWGGYAETYFWVNPREQFAAIFMAQFMPSLRYPIRNEFRTLVYQALVS